LSLARSKRVALLLLPPLLLSGALVLARARYSLAVQAGSLVVRARGLLEGDCGGRVLWCRRWV